MKRISWICRIVVFFEAMSTGSMHPVETLARRDFLRRIFTDFEATSSDVASLVPHLVSGRRDFFCPTQR
jgi:hypothetical protein